MPASRGPGSMVDRGVSMLGAGEFEMGLPATFENLAFLVGGLPAGAWVDRMRKRDVLVAADLVRSIALLALPVAWLLGVLTMPLLLVVATGHRCGDGGYDRRRRGR